MPFVLFCFHSYIVFYNVIPGEYGKWFLPGGHTEKAITYVMTLLCHS